MKSNIVHSTNSQTEIKDSLISEANRSSIEVSDLQLWQDFQRGDEAAFASMYSLNADRLYGYGMKLVKDNELVKDCIQDLFVELWDTKHRLSSVRSIKAYLFKCLRRKLIAGASKQRNRFVSAIKLEMVREATPSSEINLIEKQRLDHERKILTKSLKKLTGKQQEIIHLKYYGNLGYEEISEIMDMDKKGVYNLMAHTIKLLRQHLGDVFLTIFIFLHGFG
ncbi:sigma-70 family RNA polymerase sigma factor [Arenibacter sp. F26102]|uniref:RNA polymerase sigma factor n=1 Tax=Arenibacter sp. F26102 TaxID=2926416 RepID=UPI001FF5E14A|nr:sigma-70 family RNA polymerase sigma factor [Arenibacter sp. F26102]MCK0146214.1 sigma-70 family RNA polymerase sigma factor [Arenibacter sp. F26102]